MAGGKRCLSVKTLCGLCVDRVLHPRHGRTMTKGGRRGAAGAGSKVCGAAGGGAGCSYEEEGREGASCEVRNGLIFTTASRGPPKGLHICTLYSVPLYLVYYTLPKSTDPGLGSGSKRASMHVPARARRQTPRGPRTPQHLSTLPMLMFRCRTIPSRPALYATHPARSSCRWHALCTLSPSK